MQILSLLKSKLPCTVLIKLEELKPEDEQWTVKKFRKVLNRHIKSLEAGYLQMKLHHNREEHPQRYSNGGKSLPSDTNNNATERCCFRMSEPRTNSDENAFFAKANTGVMNARNTQIYNPDGNN